MNAASRDNERSQTATASISQIRALKAMTPTERVRALVVAANNLLQLRKNVRRV